MPDFDWAALRKQGAPIACGIIDTPSLLPLLEELVPLLAPELRRTALAHSAGVWRAVLFAEDGVTLAYVIRKQPGSPS